MTKKSIIGMIVLFAAIFFATENSFAQNGCIRMLGQSSAGCSQQGTTTTQAQASTDIYYASGGAYYGRVTAYDGVFYQIDTNGSQIKTFRNSCRAASSNGVAGYVCSFGQFDRNGRHIYSGWGYFFRNGIVYLMWTNENMGAYWRQINTPWYMFVPR